MSMLDLIFVMLGTSMAAAFVLAILVCTIGGPAIYLREFVRSIFHQDTPANPRSPSAEASA